MSNRRVLHVCLYIVWQIQEFADYADSSVDEAVDYVVPILKGSNNCSRLVSHK